MPRAVESWELGALLACGFVLACLTIGLATDLV
jgi:hypothetical protein